MFTPIRSMPLRQVLLEQAPIFGLSLVIAETFYKFHSFTLECIAFLATWYLLDFAATSLASAWNELFPRNRR
jgi:hypothetical protein